MKFIRKKIDREVLFRNQNACCVCGKPNVQVHHIDGNKKNNRISNLCVLCVEHHAIASSSSRMTRGLSPDLLRKYKLDWEGSIARRRIRKITRKPKTKLGEEIIKFEIKKTIYSLPLKNNKKEINELFEYLYNLHLFEGYTSEILRHLNFVQWFLSNKQIYHLSERIYEFFWQFVGPKDIKMTVKDEKNIKQAVELLSDFASCVITIEPNRNTLKSIYFGLKNLFKIAAIYRKKEIGIKIRRELKKIDKEIVTNIKNKVAQKAARLPLEKTQKEINKIWEKSRNFLISPPNDLLVLGI